MPLSLRRPAALLAPLLAISLLPPAPPARADRCRQTPVPGAQHQVTACLDDLTTAGLNSGDLIRLALAIEERTGNPLDDDELTALHTIAGIDEVLTARAATVSEAR